MWPHICFSLVFSHPLDHDPPGKSFHYFLLSQILPLFSSVSNHSTIFFWLQGESINAAFWYPAILLKRNCRLVYLHCKARWHHVFRPLELRRVNAYTRLKQQRGLAVWSVNKIKTHHLAHVQPPPTTCQFALEWDQSTTHQWHTIYRKHSCP